eukprot:10340934-Lingulodinium_polyedra.AAC.1
MSWRNLWAPSCLLASLTSEMPVHRTAGLQTDVSSGLPGLAPCPFRTRWLANATAKRTAEN